MGSDLLAKSESYHPLDLHSLIFFAPRVPYRLEITQLYVLDQQIVTYKVDDRFLSLEAG